MTALRTTSTNINSFDNFIDKIDKINIVDSNNAIKDKNNDSEKRTASTTTMNCNTKLPLTHH